MLAESLLDVARGQQPRLPRGRGVTDSFVERLRLHRLAPLGHIVLRAERPEVAVALLADRDQARAMHVRSMVVLDQLGTILAGIPWATFKGPVLSERAHPVPGLRTYTDLDILVEPASLRQVAHRLASVGWIPTDHRDRHHLNPSTPGQMHWRSPMGPVLDVHWAMVNDAAARRRHDICATTLLERRQEVPIGLVTAPVLDDVDAFVHVCLHAGLAGAHRLLWLLDIACSVGPGLDWDLVVHRVRGWRGSAQVAVALGRARRFLGAAVPPDIGRALGVGPLPRGLMALTDGLWPVPDIVRDESPPKVVARGVRRRGSQTSVEIARKAGLHARGRLESRRRRAPDWVPVDPAAREAYLRAVDEEAALDARP